MSRPTIASRSRWIEQAAWFLLPVPYVALVLAMIEVAQLPRALAGASIATTLALIGRSITDQASGFLGLYVTLVVVALAVAGRHLAPRLERPLVGVALIAAACAAKLSHMTLVRYPRFEGFPPFVIAWATMGVYLAWAYAAVVRGAPRTKSRTALASFGLFAAAAAHIANATYYRGAYPTLHTALLTVTFLLGHAGATQLLPTPRRPMKVFGVSVVVTAMLAISTRLPLPPVVMPYYASMTFLAKTSGARFSPGEPSCSKGPALTPEEAHALFRRHSGLPDLPAKFRVDDSNVLLVLIDTLRWDETFIGGAATSTPTLRQIAEEGAFVFERAYAPSSLTIASTGSVLSMSHVVDAPLTIRQPAWSGALRPEARTVAELFVEGGRSTFRAVHGIGQDGMQGFDQGFEESYLEASDARDEGRELERRADETIATRAIEQLRARAASGGRFFGFVFFGGPHHPYASRSKAPRSKRDGYREEIADTDAQLGRLIQALHETELRRSTVLIIAGDHGEEFGEHGGAHHGSTLYDEAVRVPLLVSVPGVHGGRQRALTSVSYVLPWLLQTASAPLGPAAREAIEARFAPMLEATGGAVVVDLLGVEARMTALVYPDIKIIYDHLSGRHQVFHTTSDSGERFDVVPDAPRELATWTSRVEAYRRHVACNRRYRLE